MTNAAQIHDPSARLAFVEAPSPGHSAVFTLVSKVTGTRFTFRIRCPKDANGSGIRFVDVLTGPENTSDFSWLGMITAQRGFVHGRKSRISPEAPSAKAFAWFWRNVGSESVEMWHTGRCGRCGRELTVPESVATGIGPVCASRAS